MSRYNVEKDGKWRCFSTVIEDYITDFMNEVEYQKWRNKQYGDNTGLIRDSNIMDFNESEERRKNFNE